MDYWTKSDGVFAEMQIISYKFITLKHIQINSQFQKILMLKVWLSLFLGTICNIPFLRHGLFSIPESYQTLLKNYIDTTNKSMAPASKLSPLTSASSDGATDGQSAETPVQVFACSNKNSKYLHSNF